MIHSGVLMSWSVAGLLQGFGEYSDVSIMNGYAQLDCKVQFDFWKFYC